ncbi:helix-turn-helix domain-containing protein [Plantactinospora sp. WMMB334]|uniref:helix-turn-helix domain-containing protein n=1 Tax=Plantactinospora sp. WMMB334 TaxID=3404119 RepID=UPI003B949949
MTRLQRLVQVRRAVRQKIDSGEARRIRQHANVSLEEIADEVGVTLDAVSKWERALRYPGDEYATRYLKVLNRLAALIGAAA